MRTDKTLNHLTTSGFAVVMGRIAKYRYSAAKPNPCITEIPNSSLPQDLDGAVGGGIGMKLS